MWTASTGAPTRPSDRSSGASLRSGRFWQRAARSGAVVICGICHAFEQASHNGDLVHAVEAGVLSRDDVTQLGDVLAGAAEGRRSEEDITVFDSTGLAIQDLAIALAAMERAAELDLPTIDF